MPPNRASCKFFVNGTCLKGEHCEYAHDLNAPANNICTFYQRGACVYGSRCKYDHVEVYRVQSSVPSSSTVLGPSLSVSSGVAITEIAPVIDVEAELSPLTTQSLAPTTAAWSQQSGNPDILEDEGVLSKSEACERKFGLLSECDHPFCITCIMKWCKSLPTFGMNVLRNCPIICRKLSYYVIPSPTWYFSKEEKENIIDNYKAKLKSIDCKCFNFGNGSYPFGAHCFYKHTVKPGSLLWKRTLNPNMYIGEHMEDVDDDDYDDDDDDNDEYDDDDDDDDHDEPLIITSMDALRALYEHLHQPHSCRDKGRNAQCY